MLKDFYVSFSAVCFTLLGLWLIVVQTRHAEWRGSPLHRRRVYGVALHFSLPGLMSLVALVDPESSALWRASFALAAIGGAVALIALHGPAPGTLGLTAYISAIALYVLIGILAIAPHIVGRLGLEAAPVRVEAVLLTLLVFAGVNVAWLLLFEEAPSNYASLQQGVEAHRASPPTTSAQARASRPRRPPMASYHLCKLGRPAAQPARLQGRASVRGLGNPCPRWAAHITSIGRAALVMGMACHNVPNGGCTRVRSD